jgi:hypothetical protein
MLAVARIVWYSGKLGLFQVCGRVPGVRQYQQGLGHSIFEIPKQLGLVSELGVCGLK